MFVFVCVYVCTCVYMHVKESEGWRESNRGVQHQKCSSSSAATSSSLYYSYSAVFTGKDTITPVILGREIITLVITARAIITAVIAKSITFTEGKQSLLLS